MLIDWFTVIAQIVNFLILLVLLKYLLYDRVLSAVDRREQRISEHMEEARKNREQAETRMQEVREKEQGLEKRRDEVLREAEQEADKHRQELEQEAQDAVARKRSEWLNRLEGQQESLADTLAEEAWTGAFRLSKMAMQRLADQQIGNGMVRAFIRELHDLDDQAVEDFIAGVDKAEGQVVIVTTESLPEEERESFIEALQQRIGRESDIEWRTDDSIGLGIEVRAGGRVLPWNMEAWLEELREDAREAVARRLERQRSHAREKGGKSDNGDSDEA